MRNFKASIAAIVSIRLAQITIALPAKSQEVANPSAVPALPDLSQLEVDALVKEAGLIETRVTPCIAI